VRSALESSGARRMIHLAGLQVPTCKADPVAGAFVNVIGTLNVSSLAKAAGVERVVYASSAAVFGAAGADTRLKKRRRRSRETTTESSSAERRQRASLFSGSRTEQVGSGL